MLHLDVVLLGELENGRRHSRGVVPPTEHLVNVLVVGLEPHVVVYAAIRLRGNPQNQTVKYNAQEILLLDGKTSHETFDLFICE